MIILYKEERNKERPQEKLNVQLKGPWAAKVRPEAQ